MAFTFNMVLSRSVSPEEARLVIISLLPEGSQIDITRDITDLPNDPGEVWGLIEATDDPDWPCLLNVLSWSDRCGLGPDPELAIASRMSSRLGIDSLCSVPDLVPDIDPCDPYWSLACIGGRWFLASTCGTALMGPRIGEDDATSRYRKVCLVRDIEVPADAI